MHRDLALHTRRGAVEDLERNTLADGLFHLAAWVLTVAGVFVLATANGARTAPGGGRILVGGIVVGWGLFNTVEGLIDHHLLGKPGLAIVGAPQLIGEEIRATCKSPVKLAKAELHWTKDREPINKRQWTTLPATLKGDVATAQAPPSESTAWFVTVTDDRGAVVSSPIVIR